MLSIACRRRRPRTTRSTSTFIRTISVGVICTPGSRRSSEPKGGMSGSGARKVIGRREFAVQFLQLAAAMAVTRASGAAGAGSDASARFEVVVEKDLQVRTRDGVMLATD